MAEHLLYGAQVGPSFEQMCCKTVAQGVRGDLFCYAGHCGKILHYIKYHYSGEPSATPVEEEYIIIAIFHIKSRSLRQILAYAGYTL